jgi:hypothetical protein
MLKSFPIFRRNDEHLIGKKDIWKNKDIDSQGLGALICKNIFDLR